jgi:hypothetical protein
VTTDAERERLVTDLDAAVNEVLAYFEGPGQQTAARIDRWGAWEIFGHFLYWHDATAWGIASATGGGPPWSLSAGADQINDVVLDLHGGESFADVARQLREAHGRLLKAARAATNLDAVAVRTLDGREMTVRQRLETIARHWRGHMQALKEA